ncbi:hypothetical protein N007_06420 [Alicyclobacillus acidoterrestris ATCC 49025]|nr:hypothetical protein N007_06420 [Alicyclobacillus acidoterrestris ATCC 49025]
MMFQTYLNVDVVRGMQEDCLLRLPQMQKPSVS